jgi:hypothetical protein
MYSEEEDEEDEGEEDRSCVCRRAENGKRGRPGPGWGFFPSARTSLGLRNDVGADLRVEKLA